MPLELKLVCCGARPAPVVEAYLRARVRDLAVEFPEISAIRIALERTREAGWQLAMALVTETGTVFVKDTPGAPRLDDCATAVDRSLAAARRAVHAHVERSAVGAPQAA
ncbi:MAG: hypothetical protein U0414_16210 [Polyangiaceae bacterium]